MERRHFSRLRRDRMWIYVPRSLRSNKRLAILHISTITSVFTVLTTILILNSCCIAIAGSSVGVSGKGNEAVIGIDDVANSHNADHSYNHIVNHSFNKITNIYNISKVYNQVVQMLNKPRKYSRPSKPKPTSSDLNLYNVQDGLGHTKLSNDVINGDIVDVDIDIKNGANVNIVDNLGYTPLYYTVWHTSTGDEAVQALQDENDQSARLYYLIADLLLKNHADPNHTDTRFGGTPLHQAAGWDQPLIVADLLRYGANIDGKNEVKTTALDYAAAYGNLKLVEIFLQHGADPTLADSQGHNATWYAQNKGRTNVYNLLTSWIERPSSNGNHGLGQTSQPTRQSDY